MTMHPMFCLQVLVRDTGLAAEYSDPDKRCWWSFSRCEVVYEKPEDLRGWEEFGYRDRWETVMVAFTQEGLDEYMELDGHNMRYRAHEGKTRVYVESFYRCPEMIAIRDYLLSLSKDRPEKENLCLEK